MSTATAAATATRLPTGTWVVDPVHSQVGFTVDYHVGTFRGTFAPLSARLAVAEDGAATLSGSVPVSGVHVQDENLVAHLKSPEFFDADRTPEISFRSRDVQVSADQIEVTGELTIRGIALPVTATGTVSEPKTYADRPYLGLTLSATVDRTRFGMNWNNALPSGEPALANDVRLNAELFLTQAGD
ncbi:MAG: YceI family protein [Acidobacteriota bacterium]|nr:YceI family protein [Acidobacteriota bacterium]